VSEELKIHVKHGLYLLDVDFKIILSVSFGDLGKSEIQGIHEKRSLIRDAFRKSKRDEPVMFTRRDLLLCEKFQGACGVDREG